MKLYIKYMVSNRCKMVVKDELKKLGLHFIVVDLGEVEIMENISSEQRAQLKAELLEAGLELMDDKRGILIEKVKNAIIELVHHSDEVIRVNFSVFLSEKLHHDYTYLANLFSEVQGTTIEQFMIRHKVERIKELIIYGELNITEISLKMNYSSVAHLSNQFKNSRFDDPVTRKTKADWLRRQRWESRRQSKPLDPPREDLIRDDLARIAAGNTSVWIRLCHHMTLDEDQPSFARLTYDDLTTAPGWQNATEAVRTSIRTAARIFLIERCDQRAKDGGQTYSTYTGYQAVRLLKDEIPSDELLRRAVSEKWIGAVVDHYRKRHHAHPAGRPRMLAAANPNSVRCSVSLLD